MIMRPVRRLFILDFFPRFVKLASVNIFVLDEDPIQAAFQQCNKHVVKMVTETAQLLCSVYPKGVAPYKRTHYNHPCAVWARTSLENYLWLLEHGEALGLEYTDPPKVPRSE